MKTFSTKNVEDIKLLKRDCEPFKFKCINCGSTCVIKSFRRCRLNRYMTLLCQPCYAKKIRYEKYGDENYNNRDKCVETVLKNGGYENIREKAKQTMIEKYGSSSYNNIDKRRKTNVIKYGVEYPQSLKETINKMNKTYLEKYGSTKRLNYNYICESEKFHSAWELALWIYAIDHNENIIREPCEFKYNYLGKIHTYNPDFLYKGKYIEIKGNQFFKDKDPSKRMICPYRYLDWSDEYKNYMDDLYEAKHQCGLSNNVEFWGKEEIEPYVKYVEDKYGIDYLPSFKVVKIPKDRYK